MGAVQQTLPRSRHKFPAPAPPQVPKSGGGRSSAGSSTTTTTATPSPVSRFSRAPHWPNDAIPKRVKKLSWDDRNSCAHMTVRIIMIIFVFHCSLHLHKSNFSCSLYYFCHLFDLNCKFINTIVTLFQSYLLSEIKMHTARSIELFTIII